MIPPDRHRFGGAQPVGARSRRHSASSTIASDRANDSELSFSIRPIAASTARTAHSPMEVRQLPLSGSTKKEPSSRMSAIPRTEILVRRT